MIEEVYNILKERINIPTDFWVITGQGEEI